MKILEPISYFFAGYTDFTDRCARPLFWKIAPVWILTLTGVTFLSLEFEGWPRQVLFWGFLLATALPFTSLLIRRLHDFNMSGFWAIGLVALAVIGGIWLLLIGILIIGCVAPSRGTNKYGDDARGGNSSVFD